MLFAGHAGLGIGFAAEKSESDWLFCRDKDAYTDLFEGTPVSLQQAQQAWYLCGFYMSNTLPLITILDEKDRLSVEKKVMEILVRKFGGRCLHSVLMNYSHLRKPEYHHVMESLIERGAVQCSTSSPNRFNRCTKEYLAHPEIVRSWKDDITDEEMSGLIAEKSPVDMYDPEPTVFTEEMFQDEIAV